jgi:hypothetical protein
VLFASIVLFLAVAVVSGEYASLQADARVGGDAALYQRAGRSGTRRSSSTSGASGVFWFGRAGLTDDDEGEAAASGKSDGGHAATGAYAAWLVRRGKGVG